MKNILHQATFFIGWLLSPFTFWNDAIINVPLAYLCANITRRFIPVNFLFLVLIFYWLTNALGLLMMYLSTRQILRDREHAVRELAKLFITVIVYSLILVLLHKIGILKPLVLG